MSKNFNLEEIMKVDVNNLAKVQHDALKEHVLNTLKSITKLIESEEYEKAYNKHVTPSDYMDAGYYGTYECSAFINFSYIKNNSMSIETILDALKNLNHTYNKNMEDNNE